MHFSSDNIILPEDVWQKIAPRNYSSRHVRLSGNWTDALLTCWETDCRIRFRDNWFNRLKIPTLTIVAECSYNECGASYHLIMDKIPPSGEAAVMKVIQKGKKLETPHASLQVRGTIRNKLAVELVNKAPTEYHYELVSRNSNFLPSTEVLKKIRSESKLAQRNSSDMWEDLRLESSNGDRYVHFRSESPIMVHLYSHAGMRLYGEMSRDRMILHLDSTGSVIRKLPFATNEGPIYYYALVLEGEISMPVAEFISSSHTVADVSYFLTKWLGDVSKLFPSVQSPTALVVDQSFCLLNAVAKSFTNHASIWQYVHGCYPCIVERLKMPNPYILLCFSHLIKCFLGHLKTTLLVKVAKDFIMRCLVVFTRLTSFDDVLSAALHLFTILLSSSQSVANRSINYFKHLISEDGILEESCDTDE